MAKDKETYDSYAKDVFDNPPAGPVGVHRGARSAGARMTPFLIVLLVVALVGVGTWGVLSGMFSDVLFGNNGTSQAADDKASDSGDSKTGGTTKSGTDEQSTSSSTDGSSSDTASKYLHGFRPERYDIEQQRRFDRCHRHERAGDGLHRLVRHAVDAAGHRRGEQGHFRPRDQRNQDLRSRRQPCVHAQAGRIHERRLRQPLRYVAREHCGLVPERDRCGDREGHRRDLGHLRRAADVGHLRARRRRADAVTVHRPKIRVPVGFVRMSPSTVQ